MFVVLLAQNNASAYNRYDYLTPILPIELSLNPNNVEPIKPLSVSEMEQSLGRKLSFKERIMLKATNKKFNKTEKVKAKKERTYSMLAAALLCFFFGIIGIHRFYLGYIGIGILQILTAGGCGIWTLIDFIRILTGSLKAKDGSDLQE